MNWREKHLLDFYLRRPCNGIDKSLYFSKYKEHVQLRSGAQKLSVILRKVIQLEQTWQFCI